MGIKHFFRYFREKFSDEIVEMREGDTIEEVNQNNDTEIDIDNLLLDMNGIFHTCAQKIYQYGNYAVNRRMLGGRNVQKKPNLQTQLLFFQEVCTEIDKIVGIMKPKRRLLLCVDGPAPLSKQAQQRQRRFRSGLEKSKVFDSNCLTPGTKMMDYLTKYIDWYIRKRMSDPKSSWRDLEVVFSNEKVPAEGEQKLLSFVRKYGTKEETYCIYGMDADLIMLSLVSEMPNFYILREEPINPKIAYYLIDMGEVREKLGKMMYWESEYNYNEAQAIIDFVFMCFAVGNDFLPHIPAVEIAGGGIDMMLDVYREVGKTYGHLTKPTKEEKGYEFRKKPLSVFLNTIGMSEKKILEEKSEHRSEYYPDEILENHTRCVDGRYEVDIEGYKAEYYSSNIPMVSEDKLCDHEVKIAHSYLEGLQWVLTYYTWGVPNWKWRYPHHYSPLASTLGKYVRSFKKPVYPITHPTLPFVQLLSVLPPSSADLLPEGLGELLTSEESVLYKYCPGELKVDLSGCKNDWEGVVLLPMMDYTVVEKAFVKKVEKMDGRDMKRNILGNNKVFKKSENKYIYKSFYGDIESRVSVSVVEF